MISLNKVFKKNEMFHFQGVVFIVKNEFYCLYELNDLGLLTYQTNFMVSKVGITGVYDRNLERGAYIWLAQFLYDGFINGNFGSDICTKSTAEKYIFATRMGQ